MFMKFQQAAATVAIFSTFLALGCGGTTPGPRNPGSGANNDKGESLFPPNNSVTPGAIIVRGVKQGGKDTNVQVICTGSETGGIRGTPSHYSLDEHITKNMSAKLNLQLSEQIKGALGGRDLADVSTNFEEVEYVPLVGIPHYAEFHPRCKGMIEEYLRQQSNTKFSYVYGAITANVVYTFKFDSGVDAAVQAQFVERAEAVLGASFTKLHTGEYRTKPRQTIVYDWRPYTPPPERTGWELSAPADI